jgi:hypothetical protein
LIEVIIITLIIAKLKGYNLKWLFQHWSIYPPLIMTLFNLFIEILLIIHINIPLENWFLSHQKLILAITYTSYTFLIFQYELYKNKNIKNKILTIILSPLATSFFYLWFGVKLNNIVITANNGLFPVFPFWYRDIIINDGIHILGNEVTKLKFLSDWIDIGWNIYSPGDVIMSLYMAIVLYFSIKRNNKK